MGLVCQNVHFLLVSSNPLFSEERVPGSYDSRDRQYFGTHVHDDLPHVHHGPISDPRIANLPELAFRRYLSILCEEVVLGDTNCPKVKVAILFSVEAYFGAYVASLYSRKPVVVVVLDRYQKRIDSVVNSLHPGLRKDHGIISKEGDLSWPIFS